MFVEYPVSADVTIGYVSVDNICRDFNNKPLVRLYSEDEIYLIRKWLFRQ